MPTTRVLAEMAEEFAAPRRGERPGVEEYAARAPALAERVRALFPTLMLLEGLAAGGPPSAGPTPATPGCLSRVRRSAPTASSARSAAAAWASSTRPSSCRWAAAWR